MNLRDKVEEIIKEFQLNVKRSEDLDTQSALQDEREHKLRAFEKKLDDRDFKLAADHKSLETQRTELYRGSEELKRKEVQFQADLAKGEEAKQSIKDLAVKIEEAKAEQFKLDDSRKQFDILKKELDTREREITKREQVDAERKRTLDIRASRIRAREAQLQLDSEIDI